MWIHCNGKIDFSHFECVVSFILVDFIPELRNIFVLHLDFPPTRVNLFLFSLTLVFSLPLPPDQVMARFSLPSVFGSAVLQLTAHSLFLFSRLDFQRRPGICLARCHGSTLKIFVRW
jgi:hypothetical protein